MAKHYKLKAPAHNSIYIEKSGKDSYATRKLNIEFALPERGVNLDTGLLLLISGFGAAIDSNVYIKMRDRFADQYNLVTVQCEYFGNRFMGSNFNQIVDNLSDEEIMENSFQGSLRIQFDENLDEFNDMSIMQGIDNITASIAIQTFLFKRGIRYNTKRSIIYGQSHGGYLAYVCNRLAPGFFHLIIDNSAWTTPAYKKHHRYFHLKEPIKGFYEIFMTYMILGMDLLPEELYDLNYIYRDFRNDCQIISCHGVNDELVNIEVKRQLLNNVDNLLLMEIEDNDVDGELFKSSRHGLNADMLKMFDVIYGEYQNKFSGSNESIQPTNISIPLINGGSLKVIYDNILPEIIFN